MKTKALAGRPKNPDKVKVVSVYLRDSEKAAIVKKYESVANAVRKIILPKC